MTDSELEACVVGFAHPIPVVPRERYATSPTTPRYIVPDRPARKRYSMGPGGESLSDEMKELFFAIMNSEPFRWIKAKMTGGAVPKPAAKPAAATPESIEKETYALCREQAATDAAVRRLEAPSYLSEKYRLDTVARAKQKVLADRANGGNMTFEEAMPAGYSHGSVGQHKVGPVVVDRFSRDRARRAVELVTQARENGKPLTYEQALASC